MLFRSLLVERARAAAGVIAVAIHGAEGEAVLYAADGELHALIDAISAEPQQLLPFAAAGACLIRPV